jgi:archaemetzincin
MSQSLNPRAVIALAPIGEVPAQAVEALVPAVRDAFGAKVVIAPALALPTSASAYDRRRRQYLSTALLDALAGARRPEWERLLGVADVDLYVPELNFVFGEGDRHRGVGVFSLARLHSPDALLQRRRAATEAIHELGHTYGLGHCQNTHCVMWFSNTLAESDRKGMSFCSEHAAQLARLHRDPFRP